MNSMKYQLSSHCYGHCEKQQTDPKHHLQFVAVEDFTIDMLPGKFRNDKRLSRLIEHIKQLTVKIDVRKKTSPDNNNSLQSLGSGIIVNVNDIDDSQIAKIITAKHVMFDSFEEKHSNAIVGFDKQGCKDYSINSFQIGDSDSENDWCFLLSKIDKGIERFEEIAKEARQLTEALVLLNNYTHIRDKHRVCLIVSHPHGCYKQVSIGRLVGSDGLIDDYKKLEKYNCLKYNTPTCQGSSGAFVLALGVDDIHVHSRREKVGEKIVNLSSGPIKVEKILT